MRRKPSSPTISKQQFKITVAVAIMVLFFIMSCTFTLATWANNISNKIDNIDTRQEHLAGKYVTTNDRIEFLEDQNTVNQVQFAEIKTKLTNIEVMVADVQITLRGTK